MIKQTVCGLLLGAAITGQAGAAEKLTLVLDWYINPDHAPIMVAEQIGAFKAEGLDVKIVPPSDPALPPRLVAAKQADLAITYQPKLHFFADQGLPLMRVGTLINTPLNTVIALDKNITSPADLKGKTVGYSVSGIEQATLATMVEHEHLKPQDIKLINVNFQLTSALLAGQAMAVPRQKTQGAAYANDFIERCKANGLVKAALQRSGQGEVTVAPPAASA